MLQTRKTHFEIEPDNVLFFDLDGTLVDTNVANFLSYKKAIQFITKSDHNLVFDPQKRFNRRILRSDFPNLTKVQYVRIIQEKERYYEQFLPKTKVNEAVVRILTRYSKTNNTVLVTNCRKERAITTLNYHKLYDNFSKFFFRSSTESDLRVNKFENAISGLGVIPNVVIAFENEEAEIADARRAGIEIINPEIT